MCAWVDSDRQVLECVGGLTETGGYWNVWWVNRDRQVLECVVG